MVGAGHISAAYLDTLTGLDNVRLTVVADLLRARAEAVATRAAGDVQVARSVEDAITRDDVDAVLNLTIPAAQAEIAVAALSAGKHVYGEKPLAATREDADQILAAAHANRLRVGCAPDTVLGTGTQTARRAVDDGLIGTPIEATAFMTTLGHESWHPDPEFYYRPVTPVYDGGTDDTSDHRPSMTNTKIIPPGQPR